MKIAAITKFKHGELRRLLIKLGWSQADLGRRSGISPSRIGQIINLQKRPPRNISDAIQKAFAEAGEFFDVLEAWPESFIGLGQNFQIEQTQDVSFESLESSLEAMMIPSPEDQSHMFDGLERCLERLPQRTRAVLEGRFFENKTLKEIGGRFGISSDRVRQIEASGIRRLKNPKMLACILGRDSESLTTKTEQKEQE